MPERRFTPADVNSLIPELERIIARLRTLESETLAQEWKLRLDMSELRRHGDPVGEDVFIRQEAELDFLRAQSMGLHERVRDLGGEVKVGYMVDFPGRIGGREVLLCWKPGEHSVAWYHGLQEGMAGRRPIPEQR